MVVLDSDIIIGISRENKNAVDFMCELEKRGESMNTTSINVFELFEGALIMQDQNKTIKIEKLINSFNSYNFDNYAARVAASISSELKKTGQTIDFPDIAIAAMSIRYGESLVTRNTKHFSRIKGLKIEKW